MNYQEAWEEAKGKLQQMDVVAQRYEFNPWHDIIGSVLKYIQEIEKSIDEGERE